MTDIQKHSYITPVSELPPPSYDEAQRTTTLSVPLRQCMELPSNHTSHSSSSFKPIVIPQTSKTFRGAFFSPFSRAYSPLLATSSNPISTQDFVGFIDGLNEAFVAAPAFQIASAVGGAMTFAPLHTVQFAGMGVQAAAGLTSAATSWTRARAFVKHANAEMFEPRGLKCKILKTKKMMVAVGHGEEVLNLPPLESLSLEETSSAESVTSEEGAPELERRNMHSIMQKELALKEQKRALKADKRAKKHEVKSSGLVGVVDEKDDPRMRRVRALGDKIAPLTFTGLPEPETMENWYKRWGAKQAQKKDAKQQKKLGKEREKGFKELDKKTREAEKEGLKYDKDILKIEKEQIKEQDKAEKELSKKKAQDPKERAKIEKDFEKEMRKLDKEMEKVVREKEKKVGEKRGEGQKEVRKADKKEHKAAQKIYWIVIDKAEVLEKEAGNEDVESLESE